jgi:hypothetical protein
LAASKSQADHFAFNCDWLVSPSCQDEVHFVAAATQGLTLATYDRRTIPPLRKTWAEEANAQRRGFCGQENDFARGYRRFGLDPDQLARETGHWTGLIESISCGADAQLLRCDREDKPCRISTLRRDVQRNAGREHRTITQVCEMLLHEGVEAYKREGPKFMQRLVAKQKARVKDP